MAAQVADVETISLAARIIHEANRAIQQTTGEEVNPPYDDAPDWMKISIEKGIVAALTGAGPVQMHDNWCEERRSQGWVYGEVKDMDAKTHPCLVPYTDLPEIQQLKDRVFLAIVGAVFAPTPTWKPDFGTLLNKEQFVDALGEGDDVPD